MRRTHHALAIALVLGASAVAAGAGQVPCGGPEPIACPDLVVDPQPLQQIVFDERAFSPSSCAVVEGMVGPGPRRLLRFTFTTPNVGTEDLVIGAPGAHPEWFEWASCHGHHHFREYADYRLWTPQGHAAWLAARATMPTSTAAEVLAAHPELVDDFVSGHKQGFCVIDIQRYAPAIPKKYTSCYADQGITVGWADTYVASLDGQWIDVTDVPEGDYVLEAEVNAERLFAESSYLNNLAWTSVSVWAP